MRAVPDTVGSLWRRRENVEVGSAVVRFVAQQHSVSSGFASCLLENEGINLKTTF